MRSSRGLGGSHALAVAGDVAVSGEHPRATPVAEASAEIHVTLNRLQREHGLTTVEMLQAVSTWQVTCLRYMLRAERHPGNPGEPADLE